MISLNPIAKKIQKRLFQKMKILSREGNAPNKTASVGGLTHNQLAVRSTFIRMASGLENPVILMGGELKDDLSIAGGYDEIYGPRGENTNNLKRPMPGVKSIDVSFQGGSRALRQATVSWTCWSFEDINRLMPHFLSVGKTVMLEWGWVYDKNSLVNLPTFIDTKNNIKRDAYTDYKNTVIDSNGDFDMMIGIVKNFEFNTRDDGAFDCTTTLSSMGVNIIDNPMPAKESAATAVRWDLSSNLTDDEIEEKSKQDNVDKLIKTDVNITLKVLIENIDNYLVDKVIDKKTNKVKKGYKQDRVTNYLELPPESAEATGVKSYPTNFNLSTSPNQFIVEHGVVSTGKKDYSNKFVNFESLKIDTVINNAWVRWGWFEDNMLSKFLSQVSNSDTPTAEFRSVNRVEDTSGKQTEQYESTRIRNSQFLETVDTKRYILPGQFTPLVRPKIEGLDTRIKGDSDYIQKLSKMVNENFKKFTAGDDVVKVGERDVTKFVEIMKLDRGSWFTKDDNKMVGTGKFEEVKTGEKEDIFAPVAGKHGFMRNMLINTKVIKEAFGVNEGGVETVNVREALESLFSLLNQDISFWKFELRNDDYEPYRTKIIDTSISEKLPEEGEVISGTTNPLPTTKSIYNKTTDEVTNNGVFFFPVWQHNSIVKRQNVQATLPSAMAVSIMYGANADIATTLGDTPAEVGAEEGVAMGKLGDEPDNKDKEMKNLNIALHQEGYERYGTKSSIDNNIILTKEGGDDNIINWLKNNSSLIAGNYNEKQQTKDEAIQAQKELAKINEQNKIIDNAVPPPIPTPTSNLTDAQWKSLGKEIEKSDGITDETILDLYSSKYDKNNKLKEKFIESISYNTTLLVTTKTTSEIDKTILLPLYLELEIDGIGGIFPSNSFHSTYVPQRYQDDTVFQIFDVNHTVSGTGWTTTLKGKMRSSVSRVSKTTTKINKLLTIKQQFANAVKASEAKTLQESEAAKKVAAEKRAPAKKAGEDSSVAEGRVTGTFR
jgi:hypothetical protein